MRPSLPRSILLSCLALIAAIPAFDAEAASGAVGERVPASLFCNGERETADWGDALKLVVLMPSRSEYGGMLRLAFNGYFRRGDAFAGEAPEIKVIYVTGEAWSAADAAFLFMENDCVPASGDALARISRATGSTLPLADDADATVLLLDKDDTVRWRDDAYRAQGEHLKPLEAAVKSLVGRPDRLAPAPEAPSPQIGDVAPDFPIAIPSASRMPPVGAGADDDLGSRLSALRGKVVLVAFYPAAFSGTLPTVEGTPQATAEAALARHRQRMMSCALQLDELDVLAPDAALKGDVVKLAISASTPGLLEDWRRTLRSRDLHFVNDPDYAIARRYGSYDAAAGYNLRKVFVVDREGRIVFVDEDYAPGDAQTIADALSAAMRAR
ncbi:MAG: redoxin family protein [Pseudomonadota bacterium]